MCANCLFACTANNLPHTKPYRNVCHNCIQNAHVRIYAHITKEMLWKCVKIDDVANVARIARYAYGT